MLVIDKPAGLLTSTVARERRPTALALAREYVARREPQARVGLIHRLDRDASGLLVFSKNHPAFRSLKKQFFDHTVDRIYTAVVLGKLNPAQGRIRSRLVELPDGSVRSTKRPDAGEVAISEYQTLRTKDDLSLVHDTPDRPQAPDSRAPVRARRGYPWRSGLRAERCATRQG